MADPSGFLAQHSETMQGAASGGLSVVLVNAMSDAALAVTERRFSRLLHSALPGCNITLRYVTLPEIARGEMAAARIARFYTSIADVEAQPPEAVIFSGAEPVTDDLRDEVFWPKLSALFDWVQARQIPALFSCLAAHAAVLHFSGVQRRRLPRKVFGMFAQSPAMPHKVLRGLPDVFWVAHSRWNELDAADLEKAGYCVLSRGPDTAVDMFVPENGAAHLFLQGHPEYEETALEGEYRRDLRRFAEGESAIPPHRPKTAPAPTGLDGFSEQTIAAPMAPGISFADTLIRNWIGPRQEMSR